jgi:hypothetical protein
MESEEKMMTGEESLKVITEMINKTKVNIRQGSFHLLFWGWLIFGCSLLEYILYKFTDIQNPWYIWLLTIPGIFVSLIYGYTKGKKSRIFTYADMIYMYIWIGFLIASIVLFIVLSSSIASVAPYILLLAGYSTFMSGVTIKFRPLIAGGISFWILTIISRFLGPDLEPLVVPVAMLTGYLIPGYLLKKKVDYDAV